MIGVRQGLDQQRLGGLAGLFQRLPRRFPLLEEIRSQLLDERADLRLVGGVPLQRRRRGEKREHQADHGHLRTGLATILDACGEDRIEVGREFLRPGLVELKGVEPSAS